MYDTSPEPSPRIEVSELAGLELQSLNPVSADDPQIPSGPVLRHTLYSSEASVLSVAADAHYIYAGAQTGQIFVWEKTYLKLKTTLTGHTGSVLTLETYQEKSWLFSASGEPYVPSIMY
ncbi:hypothetical protein FRC18_000127 [Serendipita sp. 400]|nr:hypothetical protein FRC18_000127 [Serendipita sp. 400]